MVVYTPPPRAGPSLPLPLSTGPEAATLDTVNPTRQEWKVFVGSEKCSNLSFPNLFDKDFVKFRQSGPKLKTKL